MATLVKRLKISSWVMMYIHLMISFFLLGGALMRFPEFERKSIDPWAMAFSGFWVIGLFILSRKMNVEIGERNVGDLIVRGFYAGFFM
jgi:hypothetical protein